MLLVFALLAAGCRDRSEIVVFHSEELGGVLSDVAEQLRRTAPSLRVRLEPSPDGFAVRKIVELGQRADVVVLADAALLLPLVPAKKISAWTAFATDEIVLAHKDHSRFTDEIATRSWSEVIDRPGVRLGCADPATSSVGAHALMAWELAGQQALRLRCRPGNTVAGETELVALLETRSVDYVFVHRSVASSHHLKITALPGTANLSQLDREADYRRLGARPLVCGFAILEGAANPDGARQLLDALGSEAGRRALERAGFHALALQARSP